MKRSFFIILLLLIILIFWQFWQGIYLPKNEIGEDKIFNIVQGQRFKEIAKNLEQEGLIKNDFYFIFYTFKTGKYKRLQAGTYVLNSSMTIPEIANQLVRGDILVHKITIPEGLTISEIEKKFSEILQRDIVLSDFKIKDFQNEFKILKEINPEKSLQGFLFPDTYKFSHNVTEQDIIRTMLNRLEEKLSKDLRQEIRKQNKSIFEIINMAALIEREVRTLEDKKIVSGILWRRIEIGMPLQVDATIVYILQKKGLIPEQGWTFQEMRREVGLARDIDSPYNTYMYSGLPIGPISNPGLKSILASIYPEVSEYWFYLSTPESKTIFSRTLEEHNIAKARYLR